MTAKTSGDIAIVGMACLFPGADTPQRFWANICQKLEFVGEPLPAWDAERYLQATGTSFVPTSRGGYLGEAFAADAAEMGVMPSSVDGSEPDQFLALRIAKAALVDAGALDHDHTKTGVILGHSTYLHRGNAAVVQHGVVLDQTRALLGQLLPGADPAVLDRVRAELASRLPPFNADTAPGLVPNVMTGRIANRLDLRGPSINVQTACSTSLVAIHLASQSLLAYECDMAVAGGVTIEFPHGQGYPYHPGEILSPHGRCRAFDAQSDGTVLTSGAGAVVLRRLADALQDGDPILALVKGSAINNDGSRKVSYLAPSVDGHADVVREALSVSGMSARDISLVDAHGTGTAVGDPIEVAALTEAFRATTACGRGRPAAE